MIFVKKKIVILINKCSQNVVVVELPYDYNILCQKQWFLNPSDRHDVYSDIDFQDIFCIL